MGIQIKNLLAMKHSMMEYGAVMTDCGHYRYSLWRIWDRSKRILIFIMLNPSLASSAINDPTVTRCVKRAKLLGYGGIHIINLNARITPYPEDLLKMPRRKRIGKFNKKFIRKALKLDGDIICGWGIHEDKKMAKWLKKKNVDLYCLKLNDDGTPSHPLYLSYKLPIIPYL